jgi:hypothetical protein
MEHSPLLQALDDGGIPSYQTALCCAGCPPGSQIEDEGGEAVWLDLLRAGHSLHGQAPVVRHELALHTPRPS